MAATLVTGMLVAFLAAPADVVVKVWVVLPVPTTMRSLGATAAGNPVANVSEVTVLPLFRPPDEDRVSGRVLGTSPHALS